MSLWEEQVALAVNTVAQFAIRSDRTVLLDPDWQPDDVRAAWAMIKQSEPTINDFLKILAHQHSHMPRWRTNEPPAKFLDNVRHDACTNVDVWDAGIRAGLELAVPADIAKAIAQRLRRENGARRGQSSTSSVGRQSLAYTKKI